jgi:hypothetical protein
MEPIPVPTPIAPVPIPIKSAFWLPADVYSSFFYLQEEERIYAIGTIVHRIVQGAVYLREQSQSSLHAYAAMYIAHTTRLYYRIPNVLWQV